MADEKEKILEEPMEYWVQNIPGLQPYILHELISADYLHLVPFLGDKEKAKKTEIKAIRDTNLANALYSKGYKNLVERLDHASSSLSAFSKS